MSEDQRLNYLITQLNQNLKFQMKGKQCGPDPFGPPPEPPKRPVTQKEILELMQQCAKSKKVNSQLAREFFLLSKKQSFKHMNDHVGQKTRERIKHSQL